jgi:hypothetical protein
MLQADGLPGILVTPSRPWRALSSEAVTHLVTTRVPIYVRHGQLVRIQHKEDGTPHIDALSDVALKGVLARAMNFVKLTTKAPQHIAPPDAMVKDLLTLGSWPFAPLDSIIEFPVFRPDGTLIDTPGYDPATRLFYAPTPGLSLPAIPTHPTDVEVIEAMNLINEVIRDFPFESHACYANAVALLLTPIIRQAINGHVPLALIDATRPGTGKSLLAEAVAMIATGRPAAMMSAPYDDDEWRKRIASTLAEGATIIVIDNVKGTIASASLDAALTSFVVKERILGRSKNGIYPQRATWMATGNNLQVGGDLPRRCYWIRMDAHTAQPWTRGGFKHDLQQWIPAHRGELIAALLTITRAWYADGCPPSSVPRMGSFQAWADTVGGILAHSLVEGFLANLPDLYSQADNDAAQWAGFLHAWHGLYQDEPVLVSTLAEDIRRGEYGTQAEIGVGALYHALPEDLSDIKRGDFRRRLGRALSARLGTQFDESGLHLVKAGAARSGVIRWQVARRMVCMVSQADSTPSEENLTPNTPSKSLGGGWTGTIPSEKNLEGAETNHANHANHAAPDADIDQELEEYRRWHANERRYRWEHLRLLYQVQTPVGAGQVIGDNPYGVKVRLDETGQEVTFCDPEEIMAIRSESYIPYGPDEWPYTDPAWTEERLIHHGYLTRASLGYPPREEEEGEVFPLRFAQLAPFGHLLAQSQKAV